VLGVPAYVPELKTLIFGDEWIKMARFGRILRKDERIVTCCLPSSDGSERTCWVLTGIC
jgi:hypothetical protein